MTILIVEDDPISMRLMELALRRGDYEVATACSAPAAFEWLKQGLAVDLIITDLNLGGMSGLQLFTAVHADPRWRDLPAILCTSAAERSVVIDATRRGFAHFIVKPIRPDYLLDKVRSILASRVQVMEPRFDTLARLQLSEAEYRTLIKTTHDHLEQRARELAAARAAEEYAEAIIIARSLREPFNLLVATRCSNALRAVEDATNGWQRDNALALVSQEVATLLELIARMLRFTSRLDGNTSLPSWYS
jgi:two-component system, chemotaxis family, chemotaxis protein CheY